MTETEAAADATEAWRYQEMSAMAGEPASIIGLADMMGWETERAEAAVELLVAEGSCERIGEDYVEAC